MTATLRDVTAVVVSHEAGDALLETLRSLPDRDAFAAVLIVDSGSRDGAPERAVLEFPAARLVRYDDNVGPCVTRNRGLREAATPYVLLLDDDMRLDPGVPARLLDAIAAGDGVAAAGPRICFADRPEVVQYEGGLHHYAGLPHIRHLGEAAPVGPTSEVDVLSSGCLLIRRDAALDSGGFNEAFFYLMEDVDLSLRLRYLGWRLAVVPAARAWNAGGSAGLSLRGAAYPGRRVYLHARNRCLMLLTLYHPWTLFVLAVPLTVYEGAWFAFACAARRPGAWLRGKAAVLAALPAVLAMRRRLRGRRRLRDRDLLAAPPLTFTGTALAQPAAARGAAVLDGVMRFLFGLLRGLLP